MLELQNLRVGYDDSTVVWDVDLSVEDGSVAAILGRNGAGKTTLLRGIIGHNPPMQGSVQFKGEEITGLKPYQVAARGIGYVPQSRDVFGSISVENNIRLGSASRSGRLLNRGIDEYIFDYFPALEEKRKVNAGSLSGGQQQQLAIARALNSDPDLLLLDEPSEGIQPSIVEDIGRQLTRLSQEQGLGVLIVEQNLDLVTATADHCYIIESGNIVDEGDIDTLTDENRIEKHLSV